MQTCPSTFALDDRDIHGAPADDAVGRHVAACARCASRLARRASDAARFDTQVREALWRRVSAAPRPRPWRWLALATLAPALAGAAVVATIRARPPGERAESPATYRAAKGEPGVDLAGRREGRVFAFDGSIEALAGDELELTVRAARPADAYVLVGSVDATGRFSPFYPSRLEERSVPLPAAGRPLAPPIVLDDAPGPERIVVVRSTRPVRAGTVAALAVAAAARLERFTVPGDTTADVRWTVLPKGAPPQRSRPGHGAP